MTLWPKWARLGRLHQRLRRRVRRLSGLWDHLDGERDGMLCGWALPKAGAGPVPVALYDGQTRLSETIANQFRADLRDAGLAGGHCGFSFRLNTKTGPFRVCRLDGPRPIEIGHLHSELSPLPALPIHLPRRVSMQDTLGSGINALRTAPLPAPIRPATLSRRQSLLFDPVANAKGSAKDSAKGGAEENAADASLAAPLCAYMAYLRPRYRLEAQFDWDTAPEDAAHFLNWMLASYGPMRAGLKPPLSHHTIQWLNAPQLIGGHHTSLSRATWMFLMGVPHLRQGMDFANPDWVDSVIFWWALHQSGAVSCEDCLVPKTYTTRLAGLPTGQTGQRFPLSRYMLRWLAETPALAHLSTTTEADRRQITLAAMIRAADRPDTLRYLPLASIETGLQENAGGQTPLGAYLTSLDGHSQLLPRATYVTCLRGRGYDIDTHRFTTGTTEGHRLHAAALPAPSRHGIPPVDVQVIGPVTKASGLGQAMRASIAALATTGMKVQVVNFDLDNPAPEIDIPHVPIADARPARFTLLHLNAETIPLLFAYAPDITEGSYTAAYMFWELSQPATCHKLALKLIDEIWTASDHGQAIYAPHFQNPVRVMGLANDVAPAVDPLGARAGFVARTGFGADHFLCMASFDSFSFVQRKNPLALIRAFAEAFPQDEARLLLKTQNRRRVSDPAQQIIWAEIDTLIADDPRFKILDETMNRADLLNLTAGADAYLSLHRAEGWGFGMVEAMALGVPVLATGYSGNLAYCDDSTAWLVPATEIAPAPKDYMFTPDGGVWGDPDHAAAVTCLRQMAEATSIRKRKAAAAQMRVMRDFSADAIGARYAARIDTVLNQHTGRVA